MAISVGVSGPETAKLNEVIELKYTSEDAVNSRWLVPPGVKTIAVENRLVIVPTEAGKYQITCIVVDKDYEIAADVHRFEVKE